MRLLRIFMALIIKIADADTQFESSSTSDGEHFFENKTSVQKEIEEANIDPDASSLFTKSRCKYVYKVTTND